MKKLKGLFFVTILIIIPPTILTAQIGIPTQDEFFEIIKTEGAQKGEEIFHNVREAYPDTLFFAERRMNGLGYKLLFSDKIGEAIVVFRMNIEAYPDAWNVYDSMAEAYMHNKERQKAIEFYKKSFEINPDNENAFLYQFVLSNYKKMEVQITMRDGIKLFTSVYIPHDKSKSYPIMLLRTPYSVDPYGTHVYKNNLGPSRFFTEDKSIFVYQDVRGKYMSEGDYVNVRPFIPNKKTSNQIDESSDTYDTIDWLINNIPNNNGKVGMWGISYPGFYSVMGAIDAHPALLAVSPQAPVADWFIGDDFHHHGAFFINHAFGFFSGFGLPRPAPTTEGNDFFDFPTHDGYQFFLEMGPLKNAQKYLDNKISFWNEMMTHGTYDEYWQERNVLNHLDDVKPAMLTVGGWFDAEDLYGPLNVYKTIEKENPGIENRLVMGPWSHGGWGRSTGEKLWDIYFGDSTSYYYRENIELPFFQYYLKQEGSLNIPDATVFETGSNQWRAYDQWPPKNITEKKLYLHPQGKLAFTLPDPVDEIYDEYISDPAKPVPFIGGIYNYMPTEYMVADQRFASKRPDVVVYESDILNEDVIICGPVFANLSVSTSGTDSDWIVKLIDVFPDETPDNEPNPRDVRMGGYQMLIRGEVIRGKFRNSYENPEPFSPEEVTQIRFDMRDVNHNFLKGHRIMVQVQSSWFPLVDRNPQIFTDIYHATEGDFRKARQRVYYSKEYPSYLEVKVK
jgi:putative CocE/NonD family hydrolase